MSTERDLELWAAKAEQVRRRLHVAVRELWPLIERRQFVDSWHIGAVCEHLEAVSSGEIRRLIINQPPRTTKSTVTAVIWPAWQWLAAPETQWLFASYSDRLATRHSLACRRLIQTVGLRTASEATPWIRRVGYRGLLELLGEEWALAEDEALKTRFSNTETGYRLATSVGGTATGEGGDVLVVDDPLKAEDARSDAVREAANSWWDETMSTRFNGAESAAVVVMQRLHEGDLTGHLLAQGDWEHLCLPGEYEPKHPFVWPDDPRTEEGESLDPVRLPPERLKELKTTLASYGFAGQIQQRPSPAGGGMFKRDWWRRWTPSGAPPLFERVIASWDMRFSDSQAASTSFVVGQIWGCWDADRYLLGQVRARLGFTDTVKAVQAVAAWNTHPQPATAVHSPHAHLVERKANGAAVIDTLRSKVGGLIPIEPEGGKDARAAAVQPLVEAGNVFLPAAEFIPAPAGYEATSVADFIEEHAAFPNGAHDDQVDAMSQALNWLRRAGAFRVGLAAAAGDGSSWWQVEQDLGAFDSGRPTGGWITADLLDGEM